MAILWHEMWHEALEEASRLYFGESNVEGMLSTLLPLHRMMQEQEPATLKEISFAQVGLSANYLYQKKQKKLSLANSMPINLLAEPVSCLTSWESCQNKEVRNALFAKEWDSGEAKELLPWTDGKVNCSESVA